MRVLGVSLRSAANPTGHTRGGVREELSKVATPATRVHLEARTRCGQTRLFDIVGLWGLDTGNMNGDLGSGANNLEITSRANGLSSDDRPRKDSGTRRPLGVSCGTERYRTLSQIILSIKVWTIARRVGIIA